MSKAVQKTLTGAVVLAAVASIVAVFAAFPVLLFVVGALLASYAVGDILTGGEEGEPLYLTDEADE